MRDFLAESVDFLEVGLPGGGAGEDAGLDQGLEAVADAEHRAAAVDEGVQLVVEVDLQVKRQAGAGPQGVAVGEAARQQQPGIVVQPPFAAAQLVDVHDLGGAAGQFQGAGGLAVPVGA